MAAQPLPAHAQRSGRPPLVDLSGRGFRIAEPLAREVRAPRWVQPGQLQQHALRTAAYANGHLDREEFEREPGLEPVWCRFLHDLELVTLPSADLDRIEAVL